MLNPDEKMLQRIRQAVKDLNDGHINVYTFAVAVQRVVEPNLYSSTFTAIAARAMDESQEKNWDTVLVCPNCKSDYDTEKKMCISCGKRKDP